MDVVYCSDKEVRDRAFVKIASFWLINRFPLRWGKLFAAMRRVTPRSGCPVQLCIGSDIRIAQIVGIRNATYYLPQSVWDEMTMLQRERLTERLFAHCKPGRRTVEQASILEHRPIGELPHGKSLAELDKDET